jgi:hypothetical protein
VIQCGKVISNLSVFTRHIATPNARKPKMILIGIARMMTYDMYMILSKTGLALTLHFFFLLRPCLRSVTIDRRRAVYMSTYTQAKMLLLVPGCCRRTHTMHACTVRGTATAETTATTSCGRPVVDRLAEVVVRGSGLLALAAYCICNSLRGVINDNTDEHCDTEVNRSCKLQGSRSTGASCRSGRPATRYPSCQ